MPPLRVEMRAASGDSEDDWKLYDVAKPEDQFHGFRDPTSDTASGIYLYGVDDEHDEAVVLKAADAVVFESEDIADPGKKELLADDLEVVITLNPGEEHTMTFQVDGLNEGVEMKFTHLEE